MNPYAPKCEPVPAPGFYKNPGAYPDAIHPETELLIQWANGHIDWSRTYKPPQLRWTLTGFEWDVGAVMLAAGGS